MRMILAIVAGAILTATPVRAQFALPDKLPPLPPDGAVCNEKRTHCLVNYADWIAYQMALQIAAQELVDLKNALEAERAKTKYPRCAVVKPIPVPGKRT